MISKKQLLSGLGSGSTKAFRRTRWYALGTTMAERTAARR